MTTTFSTQTLYGYTNTPTGAISGLAISGVERDADGNPTGAKLTRSMNAEEQDAARNTGGDPTQKKPLSLNDANGLVRIGQDGSITLDKSLLKDQKKLTIALGHEFGHGKFSQLNKALGWIWKQIDPEKGHGKNDPSGKEAKEEEEKTRKNYDAASKKVLEK